MPQLAGFASKGRGPRSSAQVVVHMAPGFTQPVPAGTGSVTPLQSKSAMRSDGAQPGMDSPVAWNFEKFLIGRDGKVAKRFLTAVEPDSKEVTDAIEAELAKPR